MQTSFLSGSQGSILTSPSIQYNLVYSVPGKLYFSGFLIISLRKSESVYSPVSGLINIP